jgi:hypothetical protein
VPSGGLGLASSLSFQAKVAIGFLDETNGSAPVLGSLLILTALEKVSLLFLYIKLYL